MDTNKTKLKTISITTKPTKTRSIHKKWKCTKKSCTKNKRRIQKPNESNRNKRRRRRNKTNTPKTISIKNQKIIKLKNKHPMKKITKITKQNKEITIHTQNHK